jgi:hypothetical protein
MTVGPHELTETDRLRAARGVIADVSHHTPQELRDACRTVEFYENGRIKRFLDVDQGVPNGLELTWDSTGRLLSRIVYQNGKPVADGKNK